MSFPQGTPAHAWAGGNPENMSLNVAVEEAYPRSGCPATMALRRITRQPETHPSGSNSPAVLCSICETPIPKAKRSGIGKLNNPATRMVKK